MHGDRMGKRVIAFSIGRMYLLPRRKAECGAKVGIARERCLKISDREVAELIDHSQSVHDASIKKHWANGVRQALILVGVATEYLFGEFARRRPRLKPFAYPLLDDGAG